MTRLLRLTPAEIVAAGTGRPSSETLSTLRAGEDSKRRLQLVELHRLVAGGELAAAFDLLARADEAAPAAVDATIGRPLADAWAIRAIGNLRRGDDSDAGFIASVAAAAAARAGLEFEIRIPAPGGVAVLPGLGAAAGLGGASTGAEHALARGDSGGLRLVRGIDAVVADPADPGWRPARNITVGGGWRVAIEDQDPYRDCFDYRPAPYLSAGELERLGGLLREAWAIIRADFPGYGAVMRQTLRALVPLADDPSGDPISASTQLAYGSVAVSTSVDATTMALLLVHETQHMTLGGVLDLADLCRAGGTSRHHAPWRMDPRPARALLQGTYAHLAVSDFWRVWRHKDADPQRADFEFVYWWEMSRRAVDSLLASGELTEAGISFVAAMGETLDGWAGEPVPVRLREGVHDMAEVNAVTWRLRNQRPAPGSVEQLGARRAADATGVAVAVADAVVAPDEMGRPARHRGLAETIRTQLREPGTTGSLPPGDGAYLDRDYATAAAGYRVRISEDPAADEAWVGLAAALRQSGEEPAATVLSRRPDLVRALYLDDGGHAAPEAIAGWLAPGLGPV